jgi:glycosyltransferase involved in cell wall biosynthesis
VKEVVARLDPSRFRVIMHGSGPSDPRLANRENTVILPWGKHANTAKTLLQILRRRPDVYFFPREGPLDAAFMTLRKALHSRCALVTYIVSGFVDKREEKDQPLVYRAIRECDAIAGNSRHMTETVRRLGGENVHTVYDGIDRRYYFPALGSSSGNSRVLFAGSFRPYKRVDLLVREAARFPNWEFRLAGVGEEETALRRQVQQTNSNNVRFLGHVDAARLGEEMRQAQVFFFPSEIEGHPQVLGQAAACGLPCIARSSYEPDYVIDGVTGLLTASDADLSAALSRLIGDPALRRIMSEAAVRHAQLFDWDDVTRQWAEIMEEAVARRRNHGRKPVL